MYFFVQAEDGIRDLVRSRGLGDVYKRQSLIREHGPMSIEVPAQPRKRHRTLALVGGGRRSAVSYTHLTLPTSDLV